MLTADTHLVQSWADLDFLKQSGQRTVIVGAEGAYVRDSEGNRASRASSGASSPPASARLIAWHSIPRSKADDLLFNGDRRPDHRPQGAGELHRRLPESLDRGESTHDDADP